MKNLIEKAENIRSEIKEYLVSHLDDLEFVEVDSHYVIYNLPVGDDKYEVKIWTSNGEDCAKFYDQFGGVQMDYGDYTDEEKSLLWNKAQSAKDKTGEKRNISKTQMRNDLYFSFQGVFGQVKFSGYDDNDWWTKYKPTEVRENDDIVWQVDLDTMVATYKPRPR